MITLRPTYSLLIYIICYSYIRAQCISSNYDGCTRPIICQKSTNLCRWPNTFVSGLGQHLDTHCSRPIVCQKSSNLSRWPCTFVPTFGQPQHSAGLGPVLKTKVPCESAPKIYLVGCGKDIYEIIEAIKNEGLKSEVQIHFYLFQNGRYKFLGSFITTYRILKSVLRHHNRYYCSSREYVNQHDDADVCVYDNTVIMIPESSESKALVDTGAWNLVEDKIHENPTLKSEGVVNIWNLVKKDSNKQSDYRISAPKQNEMVCTPININFKNEASYLSPSTLDTKIAKDFPESININTAYETVTTEADENTKCSNTYNLDNRNNPYYYTAKQTNYVCQPYHQPVNSAVSKYLSLPNLYSSYRTADSQYPKSQILNIDCATTSSPEGYSIQSQPQPSDKNYVPCTQTNIAQNPTALISNYAINTIPQNSNEYILSKPTYGDDSKFAKTYTVASSNELSNLEYKQYTPYVTRRPCHQYTLQSPTNIISQYDYNRPTQSAYLNQYISKITPFNANPCSEVKYSMEPCKPELNPCDNINFAKNIKPGAVTASNYYTITTKIPANYVDKTYAEQITVPHSPICNFMSSDNLYSPLDKQYVTYYNDELPQTHSVTSNTLQPLANELKYYSYNPKLPCYGPNKWPTYSYYSCLKKPQFKTQMESPINRYRSEIITKPYEEFNNYKVVLPTPSVSQEILPCKNTVLSSKDNMSPIEATYDENPCTINSSKGPRPLTTPQTSSLVVPFVPTAAMTLPNQVLYAKYSKEPCKNFQEFYPQVSKEYLTEYPKKSYKLPSGAQYSEVSNGKILPLPTSPATAFTPSAPIYNYFAQPTNFAPIASSTTLSQPCSLAKSEILKPTEYTMPPLKYTEQSSTPCTYTSTPQSYVNPSITTLPHYSPLRPTSVYTKPKEYLSQVPSYIHGSVAQPCSLVTHAASPNNYALAHTEILKPPEYKTQPISFAEQAYPQKYDESPLETTETNPCPYSYNFKPITLPIKTASPTFSPSRPTSVYTKPNEYLAQAPTYICGNLAQPSSFSQISSPLYKPNTYTLAQTVKPTEYTKYYEAPLAATQTTPFVHASIPRSYIQPSIAKLSQYSPLSPTSVYTRPKQYLSQLPSYVCGDVTKPSCLVTQPCSYSLSQKEDVNPTDYTLDPNKYTELGSEPSTPCIHASTSYLPSKTVSPQYVCSPPTRSKEFKYQQPSYICGDKTKPSIFVNQATPYLTEQSYSGNKIKAPGEATQMAPYSYASTSIIKPSVLPQYSPLRPTTVYTKPKEYFSQVPSFIGGSVAEPFNYLTNAASSLSLSEPCENIPAPVNYLSKSYPQAHYEAPLGPAQSTPYSYASSSKSFIQPSIPALPLYSPLIPTSLYTKPKEYISQLPSYICSDIAQPTSSPHAATVFPITKSNTYRLAETEILKPNDCTARPLQYVDDNYSKRPYLASFSTIPATSSSDNSCKPLSESYLLPFKTELPQYLPIHPTSIYTKPKEYLSQVPSYICSDGIQPSSITSIIAQAATPFTESPIQKYYEAPLKITQTAPYSYAPTIQPRFSPLDPASAYTRPNEYSSQALSYIGGSVAQPCSFVTQAASPVTESTPYTNLAQTEILKPIEYTKKPLKYPEQLYSQKYYETPIKVTQAPLVSYASTPQYYLQPNLHQTEILKQNEYTKQPIKYAEPYPQKYYEVPSVASQSVSKFKTRNYGLSTQPHLSSLPVASTALTVPTTNSEEYLLLPSTSVDTSSKNYYTNLEDIVKPIDNLVSQTTSPITFSKTCQYGFSPLENMGPYKHIPQPEKYTDFTGSTVPQICTEAPYGSVQPIPGLETAEFVVSPKTYSLTSFPYSPKPTFSSPIPTSYSQVYSPSFPSNVYTLPKEYYSQLPSFICKDGVNTPDSLFPQPPGISKQPYSYGLPLTENDKPKDCTTQSIPQKSNALPFGITYSAITQIPRTPTSYLSPPSVISSPASLSKFYSPLHPASVYTRPKEYISYSQQYIGEKYHKPAANVYSLPKIPIQWPDSNYKFDPQVQSIMSAPYSKNPLSNIVPAINPIPCTPAAAIDVANSKAPEYTILPTTQPNVYTQAVPPLTHEKPTYNPTPSVSQPMKYPPYTFGTIKPAPCTEVPAYTTSPISYQMPLKPCSVYNKKHAFLGAAKVVPVYTSVPSISFIPTTSLHQPYQYLSKFPSYISNKLPIPNPTTQATNLINKSKPWCEVAPTTSSYSTQPVEYLTDPTRPYSPKYKLSPIEYSTSPNAINLFQTPEDLEKNLCQNYAPKSENFIMDALKMTSPCISYVSPVTHINQPQAYLNKYVPQILNTNTFTPISTKPLVLPSTPFDTPSTISNINLSNGYQEPLEYLSKSFEPFLSQNIIPHAISVEPTVPQISFKSYPTSVPESSVYPCEKYTTLSKLPTAPQYISVTQNIPQLFKPCSKYATPYQEISQAPNTVTPLSRYQNPCKENYLPPENKHAYLARQSNEYSQAFAPASSIEYIAPLYKHSPQIPKICWPVQPIPQAINKYKPVDATSAAYLPTHLEYNKYITKGVITPQKPLATSTYEYLPSQTLKLYTLSLPCLSLEKTQKPCQYWTQPLNYMPQYVSQLPKTILSPIAETKFYTPIIPVFSTSYPKMVYSGKPCQAQSIFTTEDTSLDPSILLNKLHPDYKQHIVSDPNEIYTKPKEHLPKPQPCSVEFVTQMPKTVPEAFTSYGIVNTPVPRNPQCISQTSYYQPRIPTHSKPLKYVKSPLTGEYVPEIFTTETAIPFTPSKSEWSSPSGVPISPCSIYSTPQDYHTLPQTYTSKYRPKDPHSRILDPTVQIISPTYSYETPSSTLLYPCDKTTIPVTTLKYVPQVPVNWVIPTPKPCVNTPTTSVPLLSKPVTTLYSSKEPVSLSVLSIRPSNIYNYPITTQKPPLTPITYTPVQTLPTSYVSSSSLPLDPCTAEYLPQSATYVPKSPKYISSAPSQKHISYSSVPTVDTTPLQSYNSFSGPCLPVTPEEPPVTYLSPKYDNVLPLTTKTIEYPYAPEYGNKYIPCTQVTSSTPTYSMAIKPVGDYNIPSTRPKICPYVPHASPLYSRPITPHIYTAPYLKAAAPMITPTYYAPTITKTVSPLQTTTPTYQQPTYGKTFETPLSPTLVPCSIAPIIPIDSKSYVTSTKPLYDSSRLSEYNKIVESAPCSTNYVEYPKHKYLQPVLPFAIPRSYEQIPAHSLRQQPCISLPKPLDTYSPNSLSYTQPIIPRVRTSTYPQPCIYTKPTYAEQETPPTPYIPTMAAPTYKTPIDNRMSPSTSTYRPCYNEAIQEKPCSYDHKYTDVLRTSNLPYKNIKLHYAHVTISDQLPTLSSYTSLSTSKPSYQNNINLPQSLKATSPCVHDDNIPITSKLSIAKPCYTYYHSPKQSPLASLVQPTAYYPQLSQYPENITPQNFYIPTTNVAQEVVTPNAASTTCLHSPLYPQVEVSPYSTFSQPIPKYDVFLSDIKNVKTYQPAKYVSQPWKNALSSSQPVSYSNIKPVENICINQNLVNAFPCLAPCYNNERIQWPKPRTNEYAPKEYIKPCSPAQYTTTVDKNVPYYTHDNKYNISAAKTVFNIRPTYDHTYAQPVNQININDIQRPIERFPVNEIPGLTTSISSYSTTPKYDTLKASSNAKFGLPASITNIPTESVKPVSYDAPCLSSPKYETLSSSVSTPSTQYYTEPLIEPFSPKPKYSQIKSDTLIYDPLVPRTKNYEIPSYSQLKSNTLQYEKPSQFVPVQYPTTFDNVPCSPNPKYESSSSPISTPSTQYYTSPLYDPSTSNYNKIPSYPQIIPANFKFEKPMQYGPVQYPTANHPCLPKPKYETSYSPLNTPTTQYYTKPLLDPLTPKTKHYEIPSYAQMKSETLKYEKLAQYGPVQYPTASYVEPCSIKPNYETSSSPITTPSTQYYTSPLYDLSTSKHNKIPSYPQIKSDTLKYDKPSQFVPVQYPTTFDNVPYSLKPKYETSFSPITTPSTQYYTSPLYDQSTSKYNKIPSYPQIKSDTLIYEKPSQFVPVQYPTTFDNVPCSPNPKYESSSSPITTPSTQYYTSPFYDQSTSKYNKIPSYPQIKSDTLKYEKPSQFAPVQYPETFDNVPCSPISKYETSSSPISTPSTQYDISPLYDPSLSKYLKIPSYSQIKSDTLKYEKPSPFVPVQYPTTFDNIPCSPNPKYESSSSPISTPSTQSYTSPLQEPSTSTYNKIISYPQVESPTLEFEKPTANHPCLPKPKYETSYSPLNTQTTQHHTEPLLDPIAPKTKHYEIPSYAQMKSDTQSAPSYVEPNLPQFEYETSYSPLKTPTTQYYSEPLLDPLTPKIKHYERLPYAQMKSDTSKYEKPPQLNRAQYPTASNIQPYLPQPKYETSYIPPNTPTTQYYTAPLLDPITPLKNHYELPSYSQIKADTLKYDIPMQFDPVQQPAPSNVEPCIPKPIYKTSSSPLITPNKQYYTTPKTKKYEIPMQFDPVQYPASSYFGPCLTKPNYETLYNPINTPSTQFYSRPLQEPFTPKLKHYEMPSYLPIKSDTLKYEIPMQFDPVQQPAPSNVQPCIPKPKYETSYNPLITPTTRYYTTPLLGTLSPKTKQYEIPSYTKIKSVTLKSKIPLQFGPVQYPTQSYVVPCLTKPKYETSYIPLNTPTTQYTAPLLGPHTPKSKQYEIPSYLPIKSDTLKYEIPMQFDPMQYPAASYVGPCLTKPNYEILYNPISTPNMQFYSRPLQEPFTPNLKHYEIPSYSQIMSDTSPYFGPDILQAKISDYDSRKPPEISIPLSVPCVKSFPCLQSFKPLPQMDPFSVSPKPDIISMTPFTLKPSAYVKAYLPVTPSYSLPLHQTNAQSEAIGKMPCQELNALKPEKVKLLDSTPCQYTSSQKAANAWPWSKYGSHILRPISSITPIANINLPLIIPDVKLSQAQPTLAPNENWPYSKVPLYGSYISNQIPETGYSQDPSQPFKEQPSLPQYSPISTNEGTKLWPCYRPSENYVQDPVSNNLEQLSRASFTPSLNQNLPSVDPDSQYMQPISNANKPMLPKSEMFSISPKQFPTYNEETSPKFSDPYHKPAYPTNLETYAPIRNNSPFKATNPCTQYDNSYDLNQNQESPVSPYSSVSSITQKASTETHSSPSSYISPKPSLENIPQNVFAAPGDKISTYQPVDNYEILKPMTPGFTPPLPLYETKPNVSWDSKSTYYTETARPFKLKPCKMQSTLKLKEEYLKPMQELDNKYQSYKETKPCWPCFSVKTEQLSPSDTEIPVIKPRLIKPEMISYVSNQIAEPQYDVINTLPCTTSSYLNPCQPYGGNLKPCTPYNQQSLTTIKPTYSTSGIFPEKFSSYDPYYTPSETYTMPSHQEVEKAINLIPCALTKGYNYAYNQPYQANLKPVHNIINALKPSEISSTEPISSKPLSICEQKIVPQSINETPCVAPTYSQFSEYISKLRPLSSEVLKSQSEVVSLPSAKQQSPVNWPYLKQWFATPIQQKPIQDIKPIKSADICATIDDSSIPTISNKPYSAFQQYICPESDIIKTQPTPLYIKGSTIPKALPEYEVTSPHLNTIHTKPANQELSQIPNNYHTYATLPVGTKHVDALIANDNMHDFKQNQGMPQTGKYKEYIPLKTDLPLSVPYSDLKAYPTNAYKTVKPALSSSYEYLAKPCYENEFNNAQLTSSIEIPHLLPTYISPTSSMSENYVPSSKISLAPCIPQLQSTIVDPSQIQFGSVQALPTAKYDSNEPLASVPSSVAQQPLTTYSDSSKPQNLESGSTQSPCIASQPVNNQLEILANKPCEKALPTQYYSVGPKAYIPTPTTPCSTDLYKYNPVFDATPTSYTATQSLENNFYEILANQPCQKHLYANYDTVEPMAYSLKSNIMKPCFNVQISQSPISEQYETLPLEQHKKPWYSNYYSLPSPTYETSPKYQEALSTVNIPNIVDGSIFETNPPYASIPLAKASVQLQKPVVSLAPCYKPFISWPCKPLLSTKYKTPQIYAPYKYLDSAKSVPLSNKVSYIETTPDVNSNNLVTSPNLPCEPLKLKSSANIPESTLQSTPGKYDPWDSNYWWNKYYYGRNYDCSLLQNYLASTNPSIVTTMPCYYLQNDYQNKLPYANDNNYKTVDAFDSRLESNWLRPYVRQLAANIQYYDSHIENLKDKVLNNQQVTIDLGNTAIVQCVPNSCESVREIKTSDPSINIKTWRSKVKLLRARLVIDTDERWVTNFVPVVKACCASDLVASVAKNDITSKFGDTIVVNGYVGMYKPIVFLCNDDYLKLMYGCSNILWMNYDTGRYCGNYNCCCNPNVNTPNIYICRQC